MTNTDDSPSAIDVIRYVYLARILERRGDHESALRWQAKADEWLDQGRRGINLSVEAQGRIQKQEFESQSTIA